MTDEQTTWFADTFSLLCDNVELAVLGKRYVVECAFTALISEGHLLLEDVPGTGKTSLARAMAQSVNGTSTRIQFTPDLLPGDVTGITVFDQKKGTFEFHAGPIFANVVLADEINRASPKTQSALLEVMEEGQVTVDGVSRHAGAPFMVVATQNPIEQEGTYELPEAQMDRFLLKEIVEYPSPADEFEILGRIDSGVLGPDRHVSSAVSLEDVQMLQDVASRIYVDAAIRNYLVSIAYVTRNPGPYIGEDRARFIKYGASPRASIAFLQASRALALLNGRTHVIPEDIRTLRHVILRHRVLLTFEADAEGVRSEQIIDQIFGAVPTP